MVESDSRSFSGPTAMGSDAKTSRHVKRDAEAPARVAATVQAEDAPGGIDTLMYGCLDVYAYMSGYV